MKIVIEFYRVRPQDDAHAVVGRETEEAVDLDAAIERALALAQTLDMPQRPDALIITDAQGEGSTPARSARSQAIRGVIAMNDSRAGPRRMATATVMWPS